MRYLAIKLCDVLKRDGTKINIHSLERRFKNQLNRLQIHNASLHTWRHTFASYFIMETGNMRALQKLLGHKSIKTTMVYAHVSDDHLEHLINKLPEANLVTDLVTKNEKMKRGRAKLLKRKWWAIQDLNL
jgi:integrase